MVEIPKREPRDGFAKQHEQQRAERSGAEGNAPQGRYSSGNAFGVARPYGFGDLAHATAVDAEASDTAGQVCDRTVQADKTHTGRSEEERHGFRAQDAESDVQG